MRRVPRGEEGGYGLLLYADFEIFHFLMKLFNRRRFWVCSWINNELQDGLNCVTVEIILDINKHTENYIILDINIHPFFVAIPVTLTYSQLIKYRQSFYSSRLRNNTIFINRGRQEPR